MKPQTVDTEIYLFFVFQNKSLAAVSPPHFVIDFSKK